MTRTETIGNATLLLADCREVSLPHFDAVVSDPPYGIDHKVERTGLDAARGLHRRHNARIVGDDTPFDPRPWIGVPAILWGANNYADSLPTSAGWLVFDKRRGGTHNQKFIASDCELAWTNIMGSVKTFSHLWAGMCRDSEIGKHFHPMQKPVALMSWCIELLPKHCETIIDPFMGSGSTGVAALKTGRKFIGIEVDITHFDTACRRLSEAARQPELML